MYTAYGGKDPTLPDELAQQCGPWGHSWTRVDPRTISNYRDIARLPEGANYGRFVSEGVVNGASGMTSRSALPLDGNAGGLDEILVPNPETQITLTGVYGVNPPF